jgi:hypothetical protein
METVAQRHSRWQEPAAPAFAVTTRTDVQLIERGLEGEMGTRMRHEDLPLPLGLRARALLTEPNDLTSCQCAFRRFQPDGHLTAPPASGAISRRCRERPARGSVRAP